MSEEAQSEWARAIGVVRSWFKRLGIDPAALRADEVGTEADDEMSWAFTQGSAAIVILLVRGNNRAMLQVYSPILTLPPEDNRPAFYEEMLRLNATTLSTCSFGIDDEDEVIVVTDRSTNGMDIDELNEIISNVARYADKYDNILCDRFGAPMLGEDPPEA